jgi:hypothetical protein
MAIVKWSPFTGDITNLNGGGLDNKGPGTTTFIADLDNTVDRNSYAAFWAQFGSITPTAGGSVTLSLRRKRGSAYAENPCEQVTSAPTGTGARAFALDFAMRLPGPGIYGIYWTNNLGPTSASSGNALYRADFGEEI